MDNKYEKINLRKFRHKFTQLKDSISAGQVYEVVEKNSVLGYFVPARYKFKILNKVISKTSQQNLLKLRGIYKGKLILDKEQNYKEYYTKLIKKKYKV